MKHLWLALSPHGYGHAAMTAPMVAELRRRVPDLRVTIQTGLPRGYLAADAAAIVAARWRWGRGGGSG